MADPEQFRLSLASSDHLRTLAALMAEKGLDITIASDETHGGMPYVCVLVQGHFAQLADDYAKALAKDIARQRGEARDQADRN